MGAINRNGILYEVLTRVVTPAIPAVPGTFNPETGQFEGGSPEVPAVTEEYESGAQCGLISAIPPSALITIEHTRTVRMIECTDQEDLHKVMTVQIDHWAPDGTPMIDKIINDPTLSADAKEQQKKLFASYRLAPKSTRDSWIIPSTMEMVKPDADGNVPEGAIPERIFYQNLPDTALIAQGIVSEEELRSQQRVYIMMKIGMLGIVARAGI
ncbi:hypothetical protein [Spirosoma endbachense]|uniref:Uncharacterized protein n=1 Tax=Spirosoma endbachense TaxID=2666025 RepID=A0A6P1W5D3_9BACT|nr:hypothetical protein [Spirosoma endbachense]QHV99237.1 hypothetical protein GJR95_31360 [Spirosoma endbachense]